MLEGTVAASSRYWDWMFLTLSSLLLCCLTIYEVHELPL